MGNYNHIPFHELVNGKYGRKVAYTDAEVVTEENICSIVAKAVGILNTNKTAIDYLWRYAKGEQPILYRRKEEAARDDIVNVVELNHAYEIVQFCVGQTYGEPIQYVSRSKDESKNEAIDKLNDYNHNAFKYQRNIMQGEWKSAVGTSFLGVQYDMDNKEMPYRLVVPNPLKTIIVYSDYTGKDILAIQEMKDAEGEQYYLCFSDNREYHIKGGNIIYNQLHAYGGIPIVEVPNNQSRISDIEVVSTALDAINTLQSNRVDGVEQFVQSFIVFCNVELDETSWKNMKKQGALVIKSNSGSENKASVDMLTSELNQTETQVLIDDLWKKVLSILAIPNQDASSNSGDTQGAVSLRNGWDHSKSRARLKDSYVVEAEKKLARIILNVLRVSNKDLKITENDFSVTITHSPTDNLYTKTQALQSMLQSGVHPLIATSTCGLWGDSEKVYLQSKPYFDNLYKTIDMAKEEAENQTAQETQNTQNLQQPTEFKNMTGKPMEEL